ncbi:MAG: nucleotidyltransferase family protein [Planctomycetia bacterium]|nr:nucleotidyltransferase family protein [Planctomycetia bacterium]
MTTYEQQLNADRRWALQEGSMHFEKTSAVHKSLNKITRRLAELGIPYAVVGGMALFMHGFRRFTEDVDLLVTRESLATIHKELEGLGYVPPFQGSKQLRDTETGVRIEFLVTGDYPGDGKPKPITFPNPADVAIDLDGIRCIQLPRLIELKLASGTAPGRLKDLGDVQTLISQLRLPVELADDLDPSVRELYRRFWDEVQISLKQEEQ